MTELPTGTVTFLFTDIEASTALWEQHRDAMRQALVRHDALVEQIVAEHAGHVVRPRGEGDSRFAVFSRATDAVAAAACLQQALFAEPWPTHEPLRVRMALHTGEAELRDGDYYGSAVNRCARLRAVAHGGQTLVSLTTEQLVRGQLVSGGALHDLGEHRLKDLQHPERVFQLIIDGVSDEFPPLKALNLRPNNLPVQLTSFVGREQEVQALRARLRDPQVRLLTLTAAGGVGKTRLALQVAAELLDDFTDGVWFVDLAPLSDPVQVPSAIAQVLDIKESSGQALRESLKVSLGEKQVLLVLDNFEHVVAAAPLVSELLAAAPQMKALVTSQSLLHLYGEHQVPLPPLGHPDLDHVPSLDVLSTYTAVELFIQRARAVRPDFVLTSANASAIAGICARLDGVPLALELAAARVRIFPPQALLTRLDQRLATLTGGARDRPARHQSLRGTIDWSYNLLDPGEQRLFGRLGVFAGGCSVEAAEAVCGEPDSVLDDELVSLVDKSLVRQQERADGEPQFMMQESIREYALERLAASGEAAALRERHTRYYLAWLEAQQAQFPRAKQRVLVDKVTAETSNLAAALQWTVEQGEVELGLRLYDVMWSFWWVPNLRRVQEWWSHELIQRRTLLPPHLRAKTLARLGRVAWWRGQYAEAQAFLEEGLTLCRKQDDPADIAMTLIVLGDVHRDQGAYTLADQCYTEGLILYQVLGNKQAIAEVCHTRGELALLTGDYARVLVLEQASLMQFREVGEHWTIAAALLNQGFAAHHQGDTEHATQLFQESLMLSQAMENVGFMAVGLVGYAGVAAAQDQQDTRGNQAAERAAHLLGAEEACCELNGYHMVQAHRHEYERIKAIARTCLDETTWNAALAEGRAMTLEQAVAYALEEIPEA